MGSADQPAARSYDFGEIPMSVATLFASTKTRRVGMAAVLAAGLAVTGSTAVFAAGSTNAKERSAQMGGASVRAESSPSFTTTEGKPARSCNGGRHKYSRTKTANQFQILSGAAQQDLLAEPLVVAGPSTGRDTLLLTFTAETQLRGNSANDQFDWILGVLTVDGVPVTDVGLDQQALSGSSTYSSNAMQACVRIGPGLHKIQAKAAVVDNGTATAEEAWIDDIVLRADVLQ